MSSDSVHGIHVELVLLAVFIPSLAHPRNTESGENVLITRIQTWNVQNFVSSIMSQCQIFDALS